MVSKLLRICSGDQTSHIQGVAPHRVGGVSVYKNNTGVATSPHIVLATLLTDLLYYSFITYLFLLFLYSFVCCLIRCSFLAMSSPRVVCLAITMPCRCPRASLVSLPLLVLILLPSCAMPYHIPICSDVYYLGVSHVIAPPQPFPLDRRT